MKRMLALLLILCPLLFFSARAQALSEALGDVGVFEDSLSEEGRTITGALRVDGAYDLEGALRRLWTALLSKAKAALTEELKTGLRLFLLSFVCALCGCLCEKNELRSAIDRAGCCGAVLLISGGFSGMLDEAGETVRQLCAYARAILPTLFTACAVSGATLSAPVRYAAACLAMDVMMSAAQSLILPLIYAFYALSVCLSLYPNPVLDTAARLCIWLAVSAMTALTLAFGAYISLSGILSQSADAVAVKTAKTVIARSLPVVGGILSDSAGLLLSAAALIRNSLGVYALIAVCTFCLSPLVLCSLRLLILKAAATASALLPEAKLPGLISSFGTVFGMLLGLIGCCSAMLFISVISGMRAVGAA